MKNGTQIRFNWFSAWSIRATSRSVGATTRRLTHMQNWHTMAPKQAVPLLKLSSIIAKLSGVCHSDGNTAENLWLNLTCFSKRLISFNATTWWLDLDLIKSLTVDYQWDINSYLDRNLPFHPRFKLVFPFLLFLFLS